MKKDYFVSGHVTLIDNSTNKVLVDKDNMILNGGKELILDMLISSAFFMKTPETTNRESYSKYAEGDYIAEELKASDENRTYSSFTNIIFGYNQSEVTPEDNMETIKKLVLINNIDNYGYLAAKFSNVTFTKSTRNIEITLNFTGENVLAGASTQYSTAVITELGIVCHKFDTTLATSNDYSGDDVLFSRVRFDPISIVADNNYTLKYNLYF